MFIQDIKFHHFMIHWLEKLFVGVGIEKKQEEKEEEEGKSLVSSPSLDSHDVVHAAMALRSPAAREPV